MSLSNLVMQVYHTDLFFAREIGHKLTTLPGVSKPEKVGKL